MRVSPNEGPRDCSLQRFSRLILRVVLTHYPARRCMSKPDDSGDVRLIWIAGSAYRAGQLSGLGATSPPARVTKAARIAMGMSELRKRTEPSAKTAFAPPG